MKQTQFATLPTLSRDGFPDLDMDQADEDIHDILVMLDTKSEAPDDFHAEIGEKLADILSKLMAHAAAMHNDLVAYRKAMH